MDQFESFIPIEYMRPEFIQQALDIITGLFVFLVGLFTLVVVVLFIRDITQTKNAVRRNFPVIGRFRYIFTELGAFFRQYFFAMDREEMPFNRAQRDWVDRASRLKSGIAAFGSTQNPTLRGSLIFINCPFPMQDEEGFEDKPVTIGPFVKNPYKAPSFFNISGLSYGAISKPATRALSRGAKMAGCWLNTGEGGLSPYHLEGGCDIVFQIGTAKYGVRDKDGNFCEKKLKEVAAHDEVKMFELKLSQGAKPGKGGILPGKKVNKEIAKIRNIEPWQDSISPNRHAEVNSVPELLDFIDRIRKVSEKPVGFKSVFGSFGWLEKMCEEIKKRGDESAPDFITIDGGDGGTGAAPEALMDNVGLLVRDSLPAVVATLKKYGLKDRIKIVAAGKLLTPADVAWALCVGADFVNCGRGFMFSIGCIQAMRCNKDTCPTGVTTHNKRLQKGLDPKVKSVRAANYCTHMRKEVETIAHSCGVKSPRLLKPHHARIVQADGHSLPLNKVKVEITAEKDELVPRQH